MKFAIEFKHVIERTYTAIVEAENKKEAEKIFDEDHFSNLKNNEPENTKGLEIIINSIKEMD